MAALTGISESVAIGSYLPALFSLTEDTNYWENGLETISASAPILVSRSHWPRSSGVAVPLTCTAVLTSGGEQGDALILGTVMDSAAASMRESWFAALISDRSAQRGELSRFVHDTLSQDLVYLSFVAHRAKGASAESSATSVSNAADVVARCCRGVRVLTAMLTCPPQGSAYQIWVADNADLLREDLGLNLETDLSPEELPEEINLLFGTAVHIWFGKAVRMAPPATLSIRSRSHLRELSLELESREAVLPTAGSGWLMIEKTAEGLSGSFEMRQAENSTRACLRLPITW